MSNYGVDLHHNWILWTINCHSLSTLVRGFRGVYRGVHRLRTTRPQRKGHCRPTNAGMSAGGSGWCRVAPPPVLAWRTPCRRVRREWFVTRHHLVRGAGRQDRCPSGQPALHGNSDTPPTPRRGPRRVARGAQARLPRPSQRVGSLSGPRDLNRTLNLRNIHGPCQPLPANATKCRLTSKNASDSADSCRLVFGNTSRIVWVKCGH